MVGSDAEQSGIIRSGAKLVNAVSNSVVPKITVVVGGSFGAGNYALCGKAYDPRFIFAWPNARYAVMGAAQASDTVFSVLARARERGDKKAVARRARRTARESESKLTKSRPTSVTAPPAAGSTPSFNRTKPVMFSLDCSGMSRARRRKAHFHTGVIQV